MSQEDIHRPNILLITTDQQRYDTIQAHGNDVIFTPHLNYLASQGVSFSRCYSESPMCVPARQSIMTGRHGVTNRQGICPEIESISMQDLYTLPGLLTQSGYQTRAVGKMHFHPTRAHYGFEHMEVLEDYYRHMERYGGGVRPMDHGLGQNELAPAFSTVPESQSLTRWTAERSADFLETRDPTRPFFLWCSFAKPHPPLDCDIKYWHMYEDIPLPEPVYGDWSQGPDDPPPGLQAASWSISQADRLAPAQLRAVRRAYYACITQVDYNLGYLLGRMREMGLLENTWIIFVSDHGEMLGDHWMGAKFIPLEASARVPLIVRPPVGVRQGHPLQGQRCDKLVCMADLLPTCLNLAGVDTPTDAQLDGVDLFQSVEGIASHERLFISFERVYGMIEGAYKYIYAARDQSELLFDLASDPYEQHNLIRTGAASQTHQQMRTTLTQWLSEVDPETVRDGQLVRVGHPPSRADESGRNAWPGLHSRFESKDVLH